MTDILFENDHILIRSEYRTPDIHRHLASHIAFGIKSDLTCVVGEDTFRCRGVIIASDIEHTIFAEAGDMLLFLLDTTSERARFVQKNYLCEKEYSLLDAATVRQMSSIWEKCMDDLKLADKRLLAVLGIDGSKEVVVDERMQKVLSCLEIGREINMLKNVRSLTFRLFTDKEDAQNHCNVGNGKLALDTICNWIESTDRK